MYPLRYKKFINLDTIFTEYMSNTIFYIIPKNSMTNYNGITDQRSLPFLVIKNDLCIFQALYPWGQSLWSIEGINDGNIGLMPDNKGVVSFEDWSKILLNGLYSIMDSDGNVVDVKYLILLVKSIGPMTLNNRSNIKLNDITRIFLDKEGFCMSITDIEYLI